MDGVHVRRYQLLPGSEFIHFVPSSIKSGGAPSVHESKRIGIRQIGAVPTGTIIPGGLYALNTLYNVFFVKEAPISLEQLLGIFESKLIGWYWKQTFYDQKATFPKVKKQQLLGIPLPDFDSKEKVLSKLEASVQELLELNRKAETDTSRRHKAHVDQEIDRLVYELYGLSEEEIRIVEGA